MSSAPLGPFFPLITTRARGDPTNLSIVLTPYQEVKTIDIVVCFDFLTQGSYFYKRVREWLLKQLNNPNRVTTVLQTPSYEGPEHEFLDNMELDDSNDDDDTGDDDDCAGLGSVRDCDPQYVGSVGDYAVIDNRQVVAAGRAADPDYLKDQVVLRFYIGVIVSKANTTVRGTPPPLLLSPCHCIIL